MNLRQYQLDVIARARGALTQTRRVLVVIPTGGGKTRTAAEMVAGATRNGLRVVWLAHRIELIAQAQAAVRAAGGAATFSTVQGFKCDAPAELIVWDEAHHAAAESYKAIQERYRNAFHVGLTATPERGDGLGLRDAFDQIVMGPSIRELEGMGHLVPVLALGPASKRAELAEDPAEAWITHGMNAQGFIFCATLDQSATVAAKLSSLGISAAHVDGSTPMKLRAELVDRFKVGNLRVLCNVGLFTEGFDAPSASVCVLARAVGSQGLYLQMVGRIMRAAPGKQFARLVDLCGVTHEHGHPCEDRVYSLDGIMLARKKAELERRARICPVCSFSNQLGAKACDRCGLEMATNEAPEVRKAKIQELRVEHDSAEKKRRYYETQLRIAEERGWSRGVAFHRFKSRYGAPPPREWMR